MTQVQPQNNPQPQQDDVAQDMDAGDDAQLQSIKELTELVQQLNVGSQLFNQSMSDDNDNDEDDSMKMDLDSSDSSASKDDSYESSMEELADSMTSAQDQAFSSDGLGDMDMANSGGDSGGNDMVDAEEMEEVEQVAMYCV